MIKKVMSESNMTGFSALEHKMSQFYDTLCVRFGIMMIGPAMSGKSLLLKKL